MDSGGRSCGISGADVAVGHPPAGGIEREAVGRTPPRISVIVVNWNGGEMLAACIAALFRQTAAADEVIVVDNGSADGSAELVASRFPGVQLIRNGANLGFAGGNNVALECMTGDYALLLNNDTVVEGDFIQHLREAIIGETDSRVGMYSVRMLLEGTGRVDTLGLAISELGLSWDIKEPAGIARLAGPCGGAAVYARRMLAAVRDENGYFDRRFFLYFEDADLAWRCRKAGWRCRYVEGAVVHHRHGASTAGNPRPYLYFFFRNRVLCHLKNARPRWLMMPPFLLVQLAVLVKYLLRGEGAVCAAGIWAGLSRCILDPGQVLRRWGLGLGEGAVSGD
jgi:GT2 family glycosyltransferase